jgi:hypothetical protein
VRPCGHARVRTDASVLPPGNFVTDAIVRPSHGRPNGHRPSVRPSVIVRVTTLEKGGITWYHVMLHLNNTGCVPGKANGGVPIVVPNNVSNMVNALLPNKVST